MTAAPFLDGTYQPERRSPSELSKVTFEWGTANDPIALLGFWVVQNAAPSGATTYRRRSGTAAIPRTRFRHRPFPRAAHGVQIATPRSAAAPGRRRAALAWCPASAMNATISVIEPKTKASAARSPGRRRSKTRQPAIATRIGMSAAVRWSRALVPAAGRTSSASAMWTMIAAVAATNVCRAVSARRWARGRLIDDMSGASPRHAGTGMRATSESKYGQPHRHMQASRMATRAHYTESDGMNFDAASVDAGPGASIAEPLTARAQALPAETRSPAPR